jgi:hypothetical protein
LAEELTWVVEKFLARIVQKPLKADFLGETFEMVAEYASFIHVCIEKLVLFLYQTVVS